MSQPPACKPHQRPILICDFLTTTLPLAESLSTLRHKGSWHWSSLVPPPEMTPNGVTTSQRDALLGPPVLHHALASTQRCQHHHVEKSPAHSEPWRVSSLLSTFFCLLSAPPNCLFFKLNVPDPSTTISGPSVPSLSHFSSPFTDTLFHSHCFYFLQTQLRAWAPTGSG